MAWMTVIFLTMDGPRRIGVVGRINDDAMLK
ncbi:MAG: hypothetical protein ACJAZO_001499 [Myxococcota bacterium]|jgi:hypothetical protein